MEFINWLMQDWLDPHKISERAVRIVEGQRGKNVTVCWAISPLIGLVHSAVMEGGMTRNRFSGFVMELAQLLMYNDEPYILLCYNVSSHGDVPNFGDQGDLKYLPKYSLFLNPCEMAGSCLKAAVKRRLTEPDVQREIFDREVPRNETLHNRRIGILSREIEQNLDCITQEKCARFMNHAMGYVLRCLRWEASFD